jgi:hypothetical protein
MSETTEMELVVGVDGGVRCIYDETLDLRELGRLSITRASHVEPDSAGNWWADMGLSGGPVLGPFKTRGEALAAERGWLVGCGGVFRAPKSEGVRYTPRLIVNRNPDCLPQSQRTTGQPGKWGSISRRRHTL